jgi:histone H2A
MTRIAQSSKPKKSSVSSAKRAGLVIPPASVVRGIKAQLSNGKRKGARVSKAAPVAIAAVMEYVANEIILSATEQTQARKSKRITPRDISAALKKDPDLSFAIGEACIANTGVAKSINKEMGK